MGEVSTGTNPSALPTPHQSSLPGPAAAPPWKKRDRCSAPHGSGTWQLSSSLWRFNSQKTKARSRAIVWLVCRAALPGARTLLPCCGRLTSRCCWERTETGGEGLSEAVKAWARRAAADAHGGGSWPQRWLQHTTSSNNALHTWRRFFGCPQRPVRWRPLVTQGLQRLRKRGK